ncbi:MAG: peptide MFS transporter [Microscillaceae bacterium]|nr:peptide MFS transporter [Microscillaceae bacterium]
MSTENKTQTQTKHPRELNILFFAEMWERFSFYGMRAMLVLFMTSILAYPDNKAYAIYGAYGALVYGMGFLGGIISDRYIGSQKAVFFGGILMAIGQFILSIGSEWSLFYGLAFVVVGNGFLKPNISTMVGGLYEPDDPRKDSAFTIFYMGINLGAMAPLILGFIRRDFGFNLAFALVGVGMSLGLWVFFNGRAKLTAKGVGMVPESAKKMANWQQLEMAIYAIAVVMVPVIAYALQNNGILIYFVPTFALIILGTILYNAFNGSTQEREMLFAMLTLIIFSILFWAFFEQAGSSINLFTERNVQKTIFGFAIPTDVFQAINAIFIIIFAIPFSILWVWLAKNGIEISTPFKFSLGILQLGLGFYMFVLGASFADSEGMVPLIFLILGYMFHTTGEICLSPVGLSMITKLSPARIVSTSMGAWFFSVSLAHYVGGFIAQMTSVPHTEGGGAEKVNGLASLQIYTGIFQSVAITAVVAGILLLLLIPLLRKWMHGVK